MARITIHHLFPDGLPAGCTVTTHPLPVGSPTREAARVPRHICDECGYDFEPQDMTEDLDLCNGCDLAPHLGAAPTRRLP